MSRFLFAANATAKLIYNPTLQSANYTAIEIKDALDDAEEEAVPVSERIMRGDFDA